MPIEPAYATYRVAARTIADDTYYATHGAYRVTYDAIADDTYHATYYTTYALHQE